MGLVLMLRRVSRGLELCLPFSSSAEGARTRARCFHGSSVALAPFPRPRSAVLPG